MSSPTPQLLVQFSDTHIKEPGRLAYAKADTAAGLARAVEWVNRQRHAPKAVVVTGDLTDGGRPAQYAHLRELLAPLRCPYFLMPGNHDNRDALRAAFADHPYLHDDGAGHIQFTVEFDGLRLVALDSTVEGGHHGELCALRLAWLDKALSNAPTTPTVLALHHPPFASFIDYMDNYSLKEGRDGLAEVVRRHPQVQRIVCGHLHRSIQYQWAGIATMTAPSTAHHLFLDFGPDAARGFTLGPRGFLAHAWHADEGIVSHVVFTEEADAPFPFRDANGLID